MKVSKRLKIQTRSVTAKVTPEHEFLLKQRAGQLGLSLSEYARRILLDSLNASRDTRLVLSELLALRKIFILLQVDSSEGLKLSSDRLRHAVEQAETTKFSMADGRICSFLSQGKTNGDGVRDER